MIERLSRYSITARFKMQLGGRAVRHAHFADPASHLDDLAPPAQADPAAPGRARDE
jgi:hypothetical protein